MTIKVGINGFGRIGRQAFKAMVDHYPNEIQVVGINDLFPHVVEVSRGSQEVKKD